MAGQAQGNAQGKVQAVPRGGQYTGGINPKVSGYIQPPAGGIGNAPGGFGGPITSGQMPANMANLSKFGGKTAAPTPEYLKGFNPTGPQTMDSRQYTLNGQNMTGGSSYIAALTKHLNSIGQGGLL